MKEVFSLPADERAREAARTEGFALQRSVARHVCSIYNSRSPDRVQLEMRLAASRWCTPSVSASKKGTLADTDLIILFCICEKQCIDSFAMLMRRDRRRRDSPYSDRWRGEPDSYIKVVRPIACSSGIIWHCLPMPYNPRGRIPSLSAKWGSVDVKKRLNRTWVQLSPIWRRERA